MRFKTSSVTDRFIDEVCAKVGARNKAVLGRAGLFLALGKGVPLEFKPKDALGVELNDETVLGDDLKDVVKVALNHRVGQALDEEGYKREFRRYFEYGCSQLRELWEDSGQDNTRFIGSLMDLCEFGHIQGDSDATGFNTKRHAKIEQHVVSQPVEIKLFADDDEAWPLNQAGGNGLLIISGKPGLGKSQLALDLLLQLSEQGVRFLFFDLKGELEPASKDDVRKTKTRTTFFEATGAQYVRLVKNGGALPVNPLYLGNTPQETAAIASRMASIIRAFGPQMSASQEEEIRQAYINMGRPDFRSLLSALQEAEATGEPTAVLSKLVSLGIFADADTALPFEQWISNSIVIDFKELDNDTRVLVVAFILNVFIERLNENLSVKNGVQPLQMVLFIDEAHNILPKDSKAKLLEKLAREGRSWGFPLWLASQDADKFKTRTVNFAELANAGVHLSPQVLNLRQQKAVLGAPLPRIPQAGEAAVKLKSKLSVGKVRQFFHRLPKS